MTVVAWCRLKMTENRLLVTRSHHCPEITTHIKGERKPGVVLGNNGRYQLCGVDENENALNQKAKEPRLDSGH